MHCPGSGSPTFRYNADGFLKWADYGSGKTTTSYTQLFRNGIIEYVSAHFSWNAQGDPDKEANVFTDILEQELVKGYQDSLKTYQELQISGPFYVSISLFSLAGRRMYVGRHSFRALPVINEDGFESPEILIDPEKPMESLRILADLMWQAGGLEESPSVTDEGWDPFLDRSRW